MHADKDTTRECKACGLPGKAGAGMQNVDGQGLDLQQICSLHHTAPNPGHKRHWDMGKEPALHAAVQQIELGEHLLHHITPYRLLESWTWHLPLSVGWAN